MIATQRMYKLYYQSDLHTESTNGVHTFSKHLDNYILLNGDIGKPYEKEYELTIRNASENYKTVLILSGNNEYYNSDRIPITDINLQIQTICNKFKNVIFLNNSSYDITSDLRIIGTILWSYIPPNKHIQAILNNKNCSTSKTAKVRCREIYDYNSDGKVVELFPVHTNKLFEQNVKFIESEIKKADEEKINLIVCTHYLCSINLLDKKDIYYMFASDLEYLIKPPVIAWIVGHDHRCKDTIINDVLVTSNCKGYNPEKDGFDEEKYLEIEN